MAGSARCRPSRQPRCGFLSRIRWFLNAINNVRHGEECLRRVSNHARRPCRAQFSSEANSFTFSQPGSMPAMGAGLCQCYEKGGWVSLNNGQPNPKTIIQYTTDRMVLKTCGIKAAAITAQLPP